ncbi:unnamed protein product [Paramecium pentaurelia]|uniref:folate gamma-glutamyl hydrolase n=1 Tax=Paramecium pentaurelia TaxID=43138 RepID=A0A8S1SFV8_9CILI|nr:unnamed protein product [Paramecium pentaurelia]
MLFYLIQIIIQINKAQQDLPSCIQQDSVNYCINHQQLSQQVYNCFTQIYRLQDDPEEQWITYTQFYLMVNIFCAQKVIENKHIIQLSLLEDLNNLYEVMILQINQNQENLQNLKQNIKEIQNQVNISHQELKKNKTIVDNLVVEQQQLNLQIQTQFQQFQQQFKQFNKENLSLIKQNTMIITSLKDFLQDIILQKANYKILLHCIIFIIHNSLTNKLNNYIHILYILSLNLSIILNNDIELTQKQILRGLSFFIIIRVFEDSKFQENDQIIIKYFMKIIIFLVLLIGINYSLNLNPVIGILTIPSDEDYEDYPTSSYSYFAASYVKYVESSGARVMPIPYEADEATLDKYFSQINGLLLTGGTLDLETEQGPSKYLQTVTYLLNKVIQANQQGDTFPLFAICLGHQTLHFILSKKDYDVLIPASGMERVNKKLIFTDKQSTMFIDLKESIFKSIETEEQIYFNTDWAVLPQYYETHSELNDFFKIVALVQDSNQVVSIAAAEAKQYPIFSLGFHPEKPIFEFKSPSIHKFESILFGRNIINQFTQIARENNHILKDSNSLIFKYNPIQLSYASFAQIYFFKLGELNI